MSEYDASVLFIFFMLFSFCAFTVIYWLVCGWWTTVKMMFKANMVQMFMEQSLERDRKRAKKHDRY